VAGDVGGERAEDDPSAGPEVRSVKHELRGVIVAKPFKGTINVSGEPHHDLEREAALMLMRE
jgi:hypothetical protein